MKINIKTDKYAPVTALIIVPVCTAAVRLILFSPIPRQIGLTFRNTLYVFPLILLAALAFCTIRNRWAKAAIFCILFAMILLPYSGMINSGMSDQYALGGVIPWSDAFTMQLNTQRFLYGGQMGQQTAIRPLSTVFYAVFLHFTNNNYFALQIFLCILTAFCMISALDAAGKTYGPLCGAFFFTILYYYIRQRFGTFMTEQFGFICGLLSCQMLLTGIRMKKQLPMLAGFLLLSIGLNARPAAMFLFPAAGLWYYFCFLKRNRQRFLLGAAALALMLSGFLMNRIAQKAVYGDSPIPNRQAAEMVYGLCLGGKSWGNVVSTPEMTALNNSENVIADVASLCLPVLKEHPENILISLRTIFIDSLIRSEYYGAFSYVNGNPKALDTAARYILMVLWMLGAVVMIRERKTLRYSFLLACAAGIILSECAAVPFSTNYLRLYAVSMWVPACVTGLFPQAAAEKIMKRSFICTEDPEPVWSKVPAALAAAVIVCVSAFSAAFIRANPLTVPEAKTGLCGEDEDMLLTSVDPGSFIYMTDKDRLPAEHIPYFRLPYARQHFHDTASFEMFGFTDAIETPTAVIRGIDLTNYKDALVFAPLEMAEGKTGYAQFCGKFMDPPILRNDRFFIPTSAYFFEDER